MKLLVVGCGSIGRRHAGHAVAIAEVAVVDAVAERARACAQAIGGRAFERLDDALAWGPQAVVVATPHRTHLDVARGAIDAGADVLIEKPLSHGLEGIEAFLEQLERRGRRAFVVCNMRFHPGPAALKQALPRVGRPLFARAHVGNFLPSMRPGRDYRELYAARRAEGGGVVLDAVHEIDYLSWLFGGVASVACQAAKLSDLDLDVEDHALLTLKHESGVAASAELDYLRPRKSRGCEVIGTDGVLVWHSDGKEPERCDVRFFASGGTHWESVVEISAVDTAEPYRRLMQGFVQELERPGSAELLTARDGATVLSVALAALRSAAHAGVAQPVSPARHLQRAHNA
ncbi:MAG TPA: Gfo/Idh/MocA family oxidoreductase [Burkholderiales bacterium]|nr:Gfo/Idh/MocA family oxidoreductase [Burkholderiales bacterium]